MKVSVHEKIQEGGYGALHRAVSDDHVQLAVKKIPIEGSIGLPCLTEASVFSSFSHPSLLKAYGVKVDSGHLNIILPLGDCDLLSWRDSNPNIDPRVLKSWIYTILEALGQLHSQGLIHADIKAENVIKFRDEVKLTDFSLTRPIRKYTGLVATSTHRPPESWAGEPWDEKIDIWGLGCMIYQLVYGNSPFPDQRKSYQEDSERDELAQMEAESALNTIRIFLNMFHAQKLKLTKAECLQPFCPEGSRRRSLINTLILTCLQWDPAKRPSAQQLLNHQYFVGMHRRAGSFISTPMVYLREEASIREKLMNFVNPDADPEAKRQFLENSYQLFNRSLRVTEVDDESKLKACAWIACKLTRCPVNFQPDYVTDIIEKRLCEHLNFRLHRPSLSPELCYPSKGSRSSSSGNRRRNFDQVNR